MPTHTCSKPASIEQAGLTQQVAAKKMGISQPDVSNLLRGRFEGFSLERLLGFVRDVLA